jgi:hypothetical protein
MMNDLSKNTTAYCWLNQNNKFSLSLKQAFISILFSTYSCFPSSLSSVKVTSCFCFAYNHTQAFIWLSYLLTKKPSKTSVVVVIHSCFPARTNANIILFLRFFIFNMYPIYERNKRILVLLLLLFPSCMLLFRPWIRKNKQWKDWKQKHHVLMHYKERSKNLVRIQCH